MNISSISRITPLLGFFRSFWLIVPTRNRTWEKPSRTRLLFCHDVTFPHHVRTFVHVTPTGVLHFYSITSHIPQCAMKLLSRCDSFGLLNSFSCDTHLHPFNFPKFAPSELSVLQVFDCAFIVGFLSLVHGRLTLAQNFPPILTFVYPAHFLHQTRILVIVFFFVDHVRHCVSTGSELPFPSLLLCIFFLHQTRILVIVSFFLKKKKKKTCPPLCQYWRRTSLPSLLLCILHISCTKPAFWSLYLFFVDHVRHCVSTGSELPSHPYFCVSCTFPAPNPHFGHCIFFL